MAYHEEGCPSWDGCAFVGDGLGALAGEGHVKC